MATDYCRFVKDKDGTRFFVPACWARIHDTDDRPCDCDLRPGRRRRSARASDSVRVVDDNGDADWCEAIEARIAKIEAKLFPTPGDTEA